MPPEEALLKHYGVLCSEHVKMNMATISIKRMTRSGSYCLVTASLSALMNEMGVLTMERLLVQQLPPSQLVLNDGLPEYCVIDSNHCVQMARRLFPNKDFNWCCDIVDVRFVPLMQYFIKCNN